MMSFTFSDIRTAYQHLWMTRSEAVQAVIHHIEPLGTREDAEIIVEEWSRERRTHSVELEMKQ